jgi:hypothetical protein
MDHFRVVNNTRPQSIIATSFRNCGGVPFRMPTMAFRIFIDLAIFLLNFSYCDK